jgi:flavin-dependent dehydrogenase
MYDAIVIGARCAGAPTAMLLARAGYRVLLLDKARFPSDKVSTHYIQPEGVQLLERWGLLDAVVATNAPRIDSFTIYAGDRPMMQRPMAGPAYCPRRYLLDPILIDAAVAVGVEFREGFVVDEITMDGARVTGISGHARGEGQRQETATYVIGAEGHRSLVAAAVGAAKYHEREALTAAYYSYWSGLDLAGAGVHLSERGGVLAFPTNDGLACIVAGRPAGEFATYRANIESTFFSVIDGAPVFAARVRAGKRVERWVGTADVPNFFRKPWGDGWALVGDAGYMKDPTTGLGIADAFRDAALLAGALDEVLSGRAAAEAALAEYQARRDEAALPMYELTLKMASGELAPPSVPAL